MACDRDVYLDDGWAATAGDRTRSRWGNDNPQPLDSHLFALLFLLVTCIFVNTANWQGADGFGNARRIFSKAGSRSMACYVYVKQCSEVDG